MLTAQTKRTINWRFGPILKYTFSGGFYYDSKERKFVDIPGYWCLLWISTWYGGIISLVFLFVWFITAILVGSIPEGGEEEENMMNTETTITIITVALEWLLMSTTLSVGSVCIDYRKDMANLFNHLYALDIKLEASLTTLNNQASISNLPVMQNFKKIFKVFGCCPLIAPLLFGTSFHHKSDPVRRIFEDFFGLKMSILYMRIPVLVFYCFAAFAVASMLSSFMIVGLIYVFFSMAWLK